MNIEKFLKEKPNWSVNNQALVADFGFESFSEVKSFVNTVIHVADELNHHPTVTFGYNSVHISTTTHDAGNSITEKDLELAKGINEALK